MLEQCVQAYIITDTVLQYLPVYLSEMHIV